MLTAFDALVMVVLALPLLWWLYDRVGDASPLVQAGLVILFVFLLALRIEYARAKRARHG